MQELLNLLEQKSNDCSPWVQGRIPRHYKRVNVSRSELLRLGRLGAAKFIAAYPETSLYFTQSVLAGALLSGDYDKIYVITPSQYGKSWLMGHVGLLLAYNGMPVYIAGAAGNTSDIIMRNVDRALMDIDDGIKADITNLTKSQIERLNRSLSKDRKSFKSGGFVVCISWTRRRF